ncbi:DUF4340 domain-containing protein [Paenibacillus sp. SYP-B3998]|uniref:DUF4340 domain-containing protein n=1 Tax=Paenibacillus sp. SYP-B3998 TaxID=2678564 RepID=A0A6G4A3D1_9BACL|nr:DUF4340 domain-containing protein [Paenibacillus sp. SYP-B3998]NEW08798.1 DUF4340 domain-containing protein [Paenibacillus sp. SYP-B3998]
MKRFIPTILLVVICIGGFWYASSKDFFREKKEEPKALLTIQQEQVQSLHVQAGTQQVELSRINNGWEMKEPAAAPTNTNLVSSWLDALGLVNQVKVVEEQTTDLAKYGLDHPAQTYEVTMKDGSKKGLQVGAALPIQGYSYAMVEGSAAVYQVSDQSLMALNKQSVDFAQTNPFLLDNDKVQNVKLTWKGQSWTLAKTDKDKVTAEANWKLGDKELKGSEASPLLDQLTFLRTAVLPQPSAGHATVGGEFKVELGLTIDGKDTTETYEGKLNQDMLWLAKQGGDWAYMLTTADIQKVADAYAGKPEQPAS